MRLYGPINSGACTGGAGTSTNNADSTVRLAGRMAGMYVRYNDAPPSTTDVIIKTKGTNAPSITFLTLTNKNTNGWFFPRTVPHDLVGVALSSLVIAEPVPFDDFLNISIAQANDDDSIDVWFLVED